MLTRLDSANGLFAQLCAQWEAECVHYGERLEEYAAPHLEHARKICEELPTHDRYGVFGVKGNGGFDCLVHVNLARLPGTDGETLRLVWILLAPRFDYEEINPADFAKVATGVIFGAVAHAQAHQISNVKVHLGSFGDREFFGGLAAGLAKIPGFGAVALKANWLHIDGCHALP